MGWQIHRRLFQFEEREWQQRDVGVWVEKHPDWWMGLSIVERPVWNCLLLLCLCGMFAKTTRLVCVEAGEWRICYDIRFQLGKHHDRWRHSIKRRDLLRFAFKHYRVIRLQLRLYRGELQKRLFPKAVVHYIVILLYEGVQRICQPKRGLVWSAFSSIGLDNRHKRLLLGVLWQQNCPEYDLSCIDICEWKLRLRADVFQLLGLDCCELSRADCL